mgnify:FL=1
MSTLRLQLITVLEEEYIIQPLKPVNASLQLHTSLDMSVSDVINLIFGLKRKNLVWLVLPIPI